MGHAGLKESFWGDRLQAKGRAARAFQMQEMADLICRRLYWLDGRDRLLMELVYEKGSSYRQIAVLMKMRQSSVSRRIRKLTQRLTCREYQVCLLHRRELSSQQLSIAKDRFVAGLSRRAIAQRHRISVYRVDHHLRQLAKLEENTRPKEGT